MVRYCGKKSHYIKRTFTYYSSWLHTGFTLLAKCDERTRDRFLAFVFINIFNNTDINIIQNVRDSILNKISKID